MLFPSPLILIVDDEPEFAMFQKLLLENRGCNVSVATSGRDALQFGMLLTGRGAIAVVDMMMPVTDGLATIEALQTHYPTLHFIASSGHPEARFRERLEQLGVRHFLAKPYTTDALLRVMDEIQGEDQGLPPGPSSSEEASSDNPPAGDSSADASWTSAPAFVDEDATALAMMF